MPNRLRLLAGPRIGWHPLDLPLSILRGWWHADDWTNTSLVTNDGSGLISSFKDRLQRYEAAATTTARPTASADSFVGADGVARAGITYNGSTTYLTTLNNSLAGVLPTGPESGEMFSVASIAAGGVLIGYGNSGTAIGRRLALNANGTFRVDNGSTTNNTASTTSKAGSPHIFHGWWDGPWLGGSVDGVDLPTVPAVALNTSIVRLRMGTTLGTPASFCNGVQRESVVTTLLSEANRQKMIGYLAWDSGLQSLLPGGHPYKRGRP